MSTCATASRDRAEPCAGTAATARTWLLIEQPGPWGSAALTQSRLDPALGRALEAATAGTGVRVALIRRPGRHAESGATAPRRVFVAHTAPGRSWVRTDEVTDPAALVDLDFSQLGAGRHDGLGRPHADPLVLVCTNGKRDRCCALLGRPLVSELHASGHTDVWEVTHIGGHRFSPTVLTLPHGYAYARMTAPAVKDVVEALFQGRVVTARCRGRSAWERPGQAAELAVREHIGEEDADALTVTDAATVPAGAPADGAAAWMVTVRHADGRRWRVDVAERAAGPALPATCGAAPLPQCRPTVTAVRRAR